MPNLSWFVRMESVQRQLARLINEPVALVNGDQVELVGLVVMNGRMRLMVRDDLQQQEAVDLEEIEHG